jgi:hypothetical protein
MGQQTGNGVVYRPDGHHQPDNARLRQILDKVRERSGAHGFLFDQFGHRLGRPIEYHALMAALQKPANHVRSHSTKTDHSELHGFRLSWRGDAAMFPDPTRET